MSYSQPYHLGFDVGRYLLHQFGDELVYDELAKKSLDFPHTFNVAVNPENIEQRAQFLQGVGAGYQFEMHQ